VLRVVWCLPWATDVRWHDGTQRAGVGQASREETAGCPGAAGAMGIWVFAIVF